MAIVRESVFIKSDIQRVWEVITNVKDYSWRSDLRNTEVVDDNQFIEYTHNGYSTHFTTTVFEPYKRWEFKIENDNMNGTWSGIFTKKDGQTVLDLTEEVNAKKVIMKPFVKAYLKKQQQQFIADLKKAVEQS